MNDSFFAPGATNGSMNKCSASAAVLSSYFNECHGKCLDPRHSVVNKQSEGKSGMVDVCVLVSKEKEKESDRQAGYCVSCKSIHHKNSWSTPCIDLISFCCCVSLTQQCSTTI